jgi:hypothetical protein
LAPSDFHLFGLLKHHLGGKHFADDKDLEKDVQKWLRQQPKTYMLPVLTQWQSHGASIYTMVSPLVSSHTLL